MTSRYNIDALRNDNGTYGRAGVAFIRGALRCGHTAHIQTDLGTLAIRPYTIDEVRTYSGKRAGEVVFPGEAVGHNWLLEFYPPNHKHGDEIQWRGRSQRAALAFAFSHLNGQAHHFAHGESIKYWSNQADRDATVLAVIDDEVLIEYEMPGTTSQWGYNRRTGEYRHPATPTSALVLCRGEVNRLSPIRTYPHSKLPRKWVAAMIDQGTDDWIGMGQRALEPTPFPTA